MEKYISLAKELKMVNAKIITPEDICFDIRANLKCLWGCNDYFKRTVQCHERGTTFADRVEMVKQYRHILIVHAHEGRAVSKALLELERNAFLDGYYFAFVIKSCNYCKSCSVTEGGVCPNPEKVRPCDQMFGIDVYKTARNQGFPCDVLKDKADTQNRYGFLLID